MPLFLILVSRLDDDDDDDDHDDHDEDDDHDDDDDHHDHDDDDDDEEEDVHAVCMMVRRLLGSAVRVASPISIILAVVQSSDCR